MASKKLPGMTAKFAVCQGLNTVDDPSDLDFSVQTAAWEAAQIVNADVVSGGRGVRRRRGFSLADTGRFHSGYTDSNGLAYVVKDDSLCLVSPGPSYTTLVAVLTPGLRLSWTELDGSVYWSNGVEKGAIRHGEPYPWGGQDYSQEYDAERYGPPPAGHVLGSFASRIWIGVEVEGEHRLCFTEPGEPNFCFLGFHYLPMPARVTMIRGVEQGMYVGTDAGVFYVFGTDPSAFQFIRTASPYAPILGTDKHIFANEVAELSPNDAAIWLDSRGVTLGLPQGEIMFLTKKKVALDVQAQSGAATFMPGRKYVALANT